MKEDFGALLQRRRRLAGLTQEELAERTELSVRAIRNLELGRVRRPRRETVRRLTEALDLDRDAQTDGVDCHSTVRDLMTVLTDRSDARILVLPVVLCAGASGPSGPAGTR
jgi:transcriptional regulator with XRE-family HTH domain